MAKKKRPTPDIPPQGFMRKAESYCAAADHLLRIESKRTEPPKKPALYDPMSACYYHAIESALKAYLRVHGVSTQDLRDKYVHKLQELHAACLARGLSHGAAKLDIPRVLELLTWGNEDQGYRYHKMDKWTAEPEWMADVARAIVQQVKPAVDKWEATHPSHPLFPGSVDVVQDRKHPASGKYVVRLRVNK